MFAGVFAGLALAHDDPHPGDTTWHPTTATHPEHPPVTTGEHPPTVPPEHPPVTVTVPGQTVTVPVTSVVTVPGPTVTTPGQTVTTSTTRTVKVPAPVKPCAIPTALRGKASVRRGQDGNCYVTVTKTVTKIQVRTKTIHDRCPPPPGCEGDCDEVYKGGNG
jgi:hypothetical protein